MLRKEQVRGGAGEVLGRSCPWRCPPNAEIKVGHLSGAGTAFWLCKGFSVGLSGAKGERRKMQAALPSLVGLLLWGSCAQAEVAVQPGFDNQKVWTGAAGGRETAGALQIVHTGRNLNGGRVGVGSACSGGGAVGLTKSDFSSLQEYGTWWAGYPTAPHSRA